MRQCLNRTLPIAFAKTFGTIILLINYGWIIFNVVLFVSNPYRFSSLFHKYMLVFIPLMFFYCSTVLLQLWLADVFNVHVRLINNLSCAINQILAIISYNVLYCFLFSISFDRLLGVWLKQRQIQKKKAKVTMIVAIFCAMICMFFIGLQSSIGLKRQDLSLGTANRNVKIEDRCLLKNLTICGVNNGLLRDTLISISILIGIGVSIIYVAASVTRIWLTYQGFN